MIQGPPVPQIQTSPSSGNIEESTDQHRSSGHYRERLPAWAKWFAVLFGVAGSLASLSKILTEFNFWDDEGYMLLSLSNYVKQGHLYTRTFSEYGPFYFYVQGIFFQLLHLPINHDMGRVVTVLYWVASGLLAALYVHRLSKNVVLGTAAGLSIMMVAQVLSSEPGHPQELVLLLYMVAACLSLTAASNQSPARFFLLGCVGAALALTKVNVGVFYIAGLTHALLCVIPKGRIRTAGLTFTLLYACCFPWFLMRGGIGEHSSYILIATISGIATFAFAALAGREAERDFRVPALYAAAGLLGGTILIVFATQLQGVPFGSLIWGTILSPLGHPDRFYVELPFSSLKVAMGTVLGIALCCLRGFRQRWTDSPVFDFVRCSVGIISICALASYKQIGWVAPLLPLTLIRGSKQEGSSAGLFPRLFITCMAATQFLEPYPVAGSQVGIAAGPMILWGFLCTIDGVSGLRAREQTGLLRLAGGYRANVAVGALLLFLLTPISIVRASHNAFPPASRLPGSALLHIAPAQEDQFESIAQLTAANCGTLFTMPGMGSFNLWAGLPSPTGWHMGSWMRAFPGEQQANILRVMKSDPRSCAVVNPRIVLFWKRDRADYDRLPLGHFINKEMKEVAQIGDYRIRVNPIRTTPWIGRVSGQPRPGVESSQLAH